MAIVVIGAVSCQESNIELSEGDESSAPILYATIEGQSTRVDFAEDSDTKSIKLNWEMNDVITLYYSDGNRCCNYSCTDVAAETFLLADLGTPPKVGENYTAIYPASTAATLAEVRSRDLTSVQNGDEINDLDAACAMEAEFTLYNQYGTTRLNFKQQYAIMSFTFSLPAITTLSKLIFENGDESYTVNFGVADSSDDDGHIIIAPVNQVSTTRVEIDTTKSYTSHIMINPCAAGERTLRFKLYDDDDNIIETRATTSSKAYLAGYRYIASVSNYCYKLVGSGTSYDPYLINSAQDMWNFAAASKNNGFKYEYFLLTQDIDLECTGSNKWKSIGEVTGFCGNFNGGGHIISGCNNHLFNNSSGTIANLGLKNPIDSEFSHCCALALVNSGTLANCWVNITKESTIVGSYFAHINNKLIENCYSADSYGSHCIIDTPGDVECILRNIYTTSANEIDFDHYNYVIIDNVIKKSDAEMKSKSFVKLLNDGAFDYNKSNPKIKACGWVYNEGGYPQLDGDTLPTATATGDGTLQSPYLINSADDLIELSSNFQTETFEGQYFKQTADITLTSEWSPIGSASSFFSGNYDGGGHKISGLTIDNGSDFQGLFGVLSSTAKVSNVGIVGGAITSTNRCIGAIAGENHGTIFSCYNTIDVKGGSEVGGIAGQNYGTIEACYNKGNITTTSSIAGGIVGNNNGGKVNSAYNMGEVSGSSNVYAIAGGNTGTIENCYSSTVSSLYTYTTPSGIPLIAINLNYDSLDEFNSTAFCSELNSALTTDAWVYGIIYGTYPQLIDNKEGSNMDEAN